MEMDFSNAEINKLRMYRGANGNKICIVYQDEYYMLKFPPKPNQNIEKSYTNGCISEYIACHVFQSLGIDTQDTLLGMYGNKITVACKDFTVNGFILNDFASMKNTIIDSNQNGYGTELSDILLTIKEQQLLPPEKLENYFWEMFVGDALVGNFDRHNGNWGTLVNDSTGETRIAPIYDCGSCLYPQLSDEQMKYVLSHREEIDKRIFVFPTSAIRENDKKINYAQFLLTTDNVECQDAIIKVAKRIDLQKIDLIIEATPFISDVQKLFYKTMIKERKEIIIDKALERVLEIRPKKDEKKTDNLTMNDWKSQIAKMREADKSGLQKKALKEKADKEGR